jgi:hypothetical protein
MNIETITVCGQTIRLMVMDMPDGVAAAIATPGQTEPNIVILKGVQKEDTDEH